MINTMIGFLNSIHLDGEAIVVCLPLALGYLIGIIQPKVENYFWRRHIKKMYGIDVKPWKEL